MTIGIKQLMAFEPHRHIENIGFHIEFYVFFLLCAMFLCGSI